MEDSTKMKQNVMQLVRQLQADMRESGKEVLDDGDWENLRATVRITVEFQDYLKHGRTELARRISHHSTTPVIAEIDPEYAARLKAAGEDPSNRYDLEYACETSIPDVDCFAGLKPMSRAMSTEVKSRIDWGATGSLESFKSHFFALFGEFVAESEVQTKLRLLLDLFKLQMNFVGVCY